jgi:uncharacterized membrane protein
MITVTLYVRSQCEDCVRAKADLDALQEKTPHRLVVINLDDDRATTAKIGGELPVVELGPYRLRPPFRRQDLQILLGAAKDRADQLERVEGQTYQRKLDQGHTLTFADRASRFLANHYMALVNFFLLVYVGLPFLAPALMQSGSTLPATIIYKIYSPMCHQLAYRSWFLFGQQAYYPRELVHAGNIATYEEITRSPATDVMTARAFVGNAVTGYKVALCQRDIAIYGFMLLFGIIFVLTGRRMRSIPWFVWVVVGMIPIGVDGVSQLPSLAQNLPAWLPIRESTPLLRTITGALFGWFTAWYLFPMLEETAAEARRMYRRKAAVVHSDMQTQ